MIYRKPLIIIIMTIVVLSGISQAKQVIAVFDFDAVNIDVPTADAATQIFRAELGAVGNYTVLNKGDIEQRLRDVGIYDFSAGDINSASAKGKAVDADKAVIGSITRLGNKIIVDVQRIDVYKKAVDFSDRFSTDSVDDLDVVMRRLAKAVATGNKVERETNKFALTDEETEESRHRKSYITSGASFGFGFPIGDSSYSNADILKFLAWNMRYEAGNYVVDNSLGICWGSAKYTNQTTGETDHKGIFIIPWDIGLRYVFSPQSDISPYLGGGLGLHFIFSAKVDDRVVARGDQAMALHFSGGLYAFQSYDFRLSIDAKYTIVFSDAFYGSKSNSQQIGIYIGVARKWESGQKRILFIF
jgi:outer membrane protein W